MAQRLFTPDVFVTGLDDDVLHWPLELVAHRAEYLEICDPDGLRRALVDDDLQRIESACGDIHKLRHRLEDVRRGHDDLIATNRAAQKSPYIDILRRVSAFDG